ncbi:unnamed protein product, partial [Protopolystoma xenopodis]
MPGVIGCGNHAWARLDAFLSLLLLRPPQAHCNQQNDKFETIQSRVPFLPCAQQAGHEIEWPQTCRFADYGVLAAKRKIREATEINRIGNTLN